MQTKTIWINGKLVPEAEATLPFLTPALHYGVAVEVREWTSPAGNRPAQK